MSVTFTPWLSGRYDVAPNFRRLGTAFGNGDADAKRVLFDEEEPRYLEIKRLCLRERRAKYVRYFRLRPDTETAARDALGMFLAEDEPERFAYADGAITRDGVTIELPVSERRPGASLDMLARMVQEDIVVVQRDHGVEQVVAIHNCAPSRWAPEDVIGRSFTETHMPVPGMEKVGKVSAQLIDAAIEGAPKVRFVWSLETDDRLNRHPEPPPGISAFEWDDREFAPDRPLTVRTERQLVYGLPECDALLFLIRVGHVHEAQLRANPGWIPPLIEAVQGMIPAQLAYKGLDGGRRDAVIARLRSL